MNAMFRNLVFSAVVAAVAVLPVARLQAQGSIANPAVVISMNTVDDQMAGASYLTRAAGMPQIGMLLTLGSAEFFKNLDTTKPIGSVVVLENGPPRVLGFVGVKDIDGLLEQFADQVGDFEKQGDVYIGKSPDGSDVFVKEVDGWAFISNEKGALSAVPNDPVSLLDGLHTEYNLAVRINGQNIPPQLKEMALGPLKEGFESAMNTLEEQDPEAAKFQRKMNEMSLNSLVDLVDQLDQITLGLSIDENSQSTYLDVSATFLPGSKYAGQIALLKGLTSDFAGFVANEEAITFHGTSRMSEEDIQLMSRMVTEMKGEVLEELDKDAGMNESEREVARSVVSDLIDVGIQTIETGKTDLGGQVTFENSAVSVVVGGFVADGKKVEDAVKRLIELAKKEDELPPDFSIQLNTDSHDGIDFHQIMATVPESESEARMVFGDQLVVTLGIGEQTLYAAVGPTGIEQIKSVMAQSKADANKALPLSEFNIRLIPILEFASQFDANVAQFAEVIKASGKDKISIVGNVVENGSKTRFEIQEGVFQLIGAAASQMGAGMPGGGGAAPGGDGFGF